MEYLEDKYPTPRMFLVEAREKAVCRLWEDEADFITNSYLVVLITETFMKSEGDISIENEKVEIAKKGIETHLDRLNDQLSGGPMICKTFSVADVANFILIAFANTLGVQMTQPRVKTWFDLMLKQPSIKQEYDQIIAAAIEA